MIPKIKILKGAAAALVEDKKLLKPISIFLCLKAHFTNGSILHYNKKIETLLEHCFIKDERTFETRLSELEELQLITIDGNRINLTSYHNLHKILGLENEIEKYNYRKINAKPEHIVRATYIKENQDRQNNIIKEKIEKQNKGSGPLSNEAIQEIKEAYLKRLIDAFRFSVQPTSDFLMYRPDVAICQNTLAMRFNCKSQSSGYYWQKVLLKHELITVENRIIESTVRCRESKLGKVFWSNDEKKKTCLQLPNKITVL